MKNCLFALLSCLLLSMPLVARGHQSGTDRLLSEKIRLVEQTTAQATGVLLGAISEPEFAAYFAATGAAEKTRLKAALDQRVLRISQLFESDEVCAIDVFGREISRVLNNEISQDLSEDEGKAAFFRGAMASMPGEVFIAAPYISEDTNEWVIGYTVQISHNNRTKGVLHLERSLKGLQRTLYAGLEGKPHFIVALDEAGWIIADSRHDIDIKRKRAKVFPGDYFERFDVPDHNFLALINNAHSGSGVVKKRGNTYYYSFEHIGPLTLFAFEVSK